MHGVTCAVRKALGLLDSDASDMKSRQVELELAKPDWRRQCQGSGGPVEGHWSVIARRLLAEAVQAFPAHLTL